ncbi:TIGR02449 family protein [Aquimonas voraii]|uniref:Cell division protein ZapB n=1 Tax=Aquimonas voraii TaxID=265719 RepID=A0A1G6X872_9GAMM|nr:TIGR02449 family protein [Aquimonas voraii]SDD74339.1 cell division protein ZapB [Aquimonas voraii]
MSIPDPVEQLAALAERVERLAALVQQLSGENANLRQSQQQLLGERASLLSKNEQARARVEAMIQRLKSLEQSA